MSGNVAYFYPTKNEYLIGDLHFDLLTAEMLLQSLNGWVEEQKAAQQLRELDAAPTSAAEGEHEQGARQ